VIECVVHGYAFVLACKVGFSCWCGGTLKLLKSG
jgi:hypothetical protein